MLKSILILSAALSVSSTFSGFPSTCVSSTGLYKMKLELARDAGTITESNFLNLSVIDLRTAKGSKAQDPHTYRGADQSAFMHEASAEEDGSLSSVERVSTFAFPLELAVDFKFTGALPSTFKAQLSSEYTASPISFDCTHVR